MHIVVISAQCSNDLYYNIVRLKQTENGGTDASQRKEYEHYENRRRLGAQVCLMKL